MAVRGSCHRLFDRRVTLPEVLKTPYSPRIMILVAVIVALALTAAACDSSGGTQTSTVPPQEATSATVATTTTAAPLTAIPPNSIPGENSPSIPSDVGEAMRAQVGVLILDVEESRGLPFLEIPTVTILDETDFTARVTATLEKELDPEEVAGDQALFELLGMLDASTDLYRLLIDLSTEGILGFYDPDAGELVVPVSADGISPFQELTITHELVHALTNQQFEYNDVYEQRIEEGTRDDAAAILALLEGDATYQQFLYLESMDPADAANAVLEWRSFDRSVLDSVPRWIQQDLAFPYEQGLVFAGALVVDEGLKGLDGAYLQLPISSEQILHPEKYARSEQPSALASLTVELTGWELFDEATFGEWGIRMILLDSLRPGAVTQAAAGWGNDTYRVFLNGDDTAIAWVYDGETIEDAEELADGLIAHIRGTMDAGTPEESGGGLLFSGGSTYVFIDRVDDQIFFVASTDPAAGASLREQLGER
ncbi:MAG: hypothetical protein BMS9Abin12_1197 [Acidimicrobiia bacterium]|nr:MAG: hypothetical protein BMS9Abin12_1197 [Acidimicrobiia bacterium]